MKSLSNDPAESLFRSLFAANDHLGFPSNTATCIQQIAVDPLLQLWNLPIISFFRGNRLNRRDYVADDECACARRRSLSSDAVCKFLAKSLTNPFESSLDSKRSNQTIGEILSLKLLLCNLIDNVAHALEKGAGNHSSTSRSTKLSKGNVFLPRMGFARVGGTPENMMDVGAAEGGDEGESVDDGSVNREESQKLINIPSNVERLRSTMSNFSLTELVEFFPTLGRTLNEHPDKKRLISVQDFFGYTEAEGRQFFEELDRDRDGQVTIEDVEVAIRKRNLPRRYARDFFRRTRRHLFCKTFGWKQFLSLIKQKDPTILQAYTTLCLSKSGTLQKNQIMATLENASLPANEENVISMLRYLIADTDGSISYSHFRNFMLLIPSEHLK